MKEQGIEIESKRNGIHILIPSGLLKHVAKYHPEGIKVTNFTEMKKAVISKLDDSLGTPESGLSGLQELIDKAIYEAAEDGDGCEFKEIDY